MELPQLADEKVERQQPTLLAAETAQRIYNDPDEAVAIIDELRLKLEDSYKEMFATDQPRASYLRERAVWMASIAPLLHGAELLLARAALPFMQRGLSLRDNLPFRRMSYDDSRLMRPITPACRAFLRTGVSWVVNVGTQIERSEDFSDIWSLYADAHQTFCELEQQQRDYKRNTNASTHFAEALADGTDLPLALLQQFGQHYGRGLSPKACKQACLAKIDQLSWMTSTRRNFLTERIIKHWKNEELCPYNKAADLAARGVWRVSSLRDAPWKVPGFCPANIVLQSPHVEDRETIDQLRNLCGQQSSTEGVTAAWVRLVFGAHLAEETLWSDRED